MGPRTYEVLPALGLARHLAIRTMCTAQHKQIGQAANSYATDFDGILPPGPGVGAPYYTEWLQRPAFGFYLLTNYLGDRPTKRGRLRSKRTVKRGFPPA